MKQKFTSLPSSVLTLSRDGVTLSLSLTARAPGITTAIMAAYPAPVGGWVNDAGKPPRQLPAKPEHTAIYSHRRTMIFIGLWLRSEIETIQPAASADRATWMAFAAAVEDELVDACFSQGEINAIVDAALTLEDASSKTQEKAMKREQGN